MTGYDQKRATEEMALLRGDKATIHLNDGGIEQGLVTKSNRTYLEIDGSTVIPWNSIVRIIKK